MATKKDLKLLAQHVRLLTPSIFFSTMASEWRYVVQGAAVLLYSDGDPRSEHWFEVGLSENSPFIARLAKAARWGSAGALQTTGLDASKLESFIERFLLDDRG